MERGDRLNIKSFTIYKEYYELITLLNQREQEEFLLAIVRYMFEDVEPILNNKQQKIFNNLKRPLDVSKNKSKNARKENQTEIKSKSNENQTEIKKDIKRDNTSMMLMSMSNVYVNVYKDIIDYLNLKTNKNYRYTTKKTQDLIKARLNEGFTLEDFKTVIDKKIQDEYFIENDYLRPETLFSNKFESYLNQNVKKIKTAEDKSNNLKELMKYR